MAWTDDLKAALFGTPAQAHQVNRFNPQQMSALQQLLGQGLQGMQNPYQGFQPIEDQARTNFAQQTVPSIAERFTAMGNSASSSPLFASQLGQAGAGLEGNLAAMKSQYGMQNQSQLMQLLSMALQPQFENYMQPGQGGFAQPVLQALGRAGVGAAGGAMMGGPAGAAAGGLAGLFGGGSGGQSQVSMMPSMMQGQYPFMPSQYRNPNYSIFNQNQA